MLKAEWEKLVTFWLRVIAKREEETYNARHRFAKGIQYYIRTNDVKIVIHKNINKGRRAIVSLQRDLERRQRRNSYA